GFNGRGEATLIYGRSVGSPSGRINGTFALASLASSGITFAQFTGASFPSNSRAGQSVTAVRNMNADNINEIAIGAPGLNNGSGAAYLIPGNRALQGVFPLTQTQGVAPLFDLVLSTAQSGVNGVGQGVSGNLSGRQLDGNGIGDLIVGAP